MKKENLLNVVLMVVIGVLVVVGTVSAATTISTNIVTEGTLSVTGTATSSISSNFAVGTSTPWGRGLFTVGTSSPSFFVDQVTGNVGIGSISPTSPFEIVGTGSGSTASLTAILGPNRIPSDGQGQLALYSTDAMAVDLGGEIVFGGQDGATVRRTFAAVSGRKENSTSGNRAGYLQFAVRAPALGNDLNEFMRITSTGNVGIGTTTPVTKLHVSSGASATTTVTIGELGLSSSKACVNMNQANGSAGSFYLVGGALVVENNYCR